MIYSLRDVSSRIMYTSRTCREEIQLKEYGMDWYQIVGLIIAFLTFAAVTAQAFIACYLKKLTRIQAEINRLNLHVLTMSVEATYVLETLSQSLAQINLAKELGEEVSKEAKELTETTVKWHCNFRPHLDELKKQLFVKAPLDPKKSTEDGARDI